MNKCDLEETKHMAMEKLRELMKTPEKWKWHYHYLRCHPYDISRTSVDMRVSIWNYDEVVLSRCCTIQHKYPDWREFYDRLYEEKRAAREQAKCERLLRAVQRIDKPWWKIW